MAYRRYTKDYVDEEDVARAEHIGMWRGEFVPPWDWRKRHQGGDMRQDFAIHSFTRYETRDQDLGKGVVRLHSCWSNRLHMKRGALVKISALEGDQIEGAVYCVYRAGTGPG